MVDLLIPGPEGKIEAKYTHNNNDQSPIALILHPDPSRGGTMNTKIVFKLYKIFVNNGFSAIRFNFRGVGKSEGIYDDGEGELSDAASVLDWLQQYNTNSKTCWVVGFSFGAWVAMAIHDTSSVLGAAMAYGGSTIEIATTLKLGRTIWLIPLMLLIGLLYKDKSNSKIKFPIFIFIFVIALLLGPYLNLSQNTLSLLESISKIFLIAALFCIGTQINYESMKGIEIKTLSIALILWIFASVVAYLLIDLLI